MQQCVHPFRSNKRTNCQSARTWHRWVACKAVSSPPCDSRKSRVVFLGTPDVAVLVLKELVAASQQPDAKFEVAAVVSQPGKPKGRGNKSTPLPTPVQEAAAQLGLQERVLAPAKAKDDAFIATMQELQPDLCITAAYGNILPQKFLDIPRLGTLNIHPSLLPRYRGAAPVQRCLQNGDQEGGVSIAYTVLKCDAGPILAQQKVTIDPDIQAPEFLSQMFYQGVQLLLQHMPDILSGKGQELAIPQDKSAVTHADKLRKEDGVLDFWGSSAVQLHNTVRGLAGWPGTVGRFLLIDDATGVSEPLEVRIIKTSYPKDADLHAYQAHVPLDIHKQLEVGWATDGSGDMLVPCGLTASFTTGITSVLRVSMVQPPTKKAMHARDFKNGLRKKRLVVAPVHAEQSNSVSAGAS